MQIRFAMTPMKPNLNVHECVQVQSGLGCEIVNIKHNACTQCNLMQSSLFKDMGQSLLSPVQTPVLPFHKKSASSKFLLCAHYRI